MPNIFKFNIGPDFVSKASRAIEAFLAQQEVSPIRIALSGGNSPKEVYKKLAQSETIDWSQIEIYQVDERSDHSNAAMIRETLVDQLPSLKAFYEFNDKYEDRLQKLSKPLFHLVLLGLGADGHLASLFPNSEALEVTDALTTRSQSPSGIKKRLTLTFPAIMSSQKIIFLIRGNGKKEIVDRWLNDETVSENEIPAKVILDHEDVDIYFDYST